MRMVADVGFDDFSEQTAAGPVVTFFKPPCVFVVGNDFVCSPANMKDGDLVSYEVINMIDRIALIGLGFSGRFESVGFEE